MIRVGLTGGIGSGKSTVAQLLATWGAVVIDADVLARAAVAPGTPGLSQVVDEFGPGVLTADGALDRPALAALAFADPDRLAVLNAIVHPDVSRRTEAMIAALPENAVVVHDVPLLVENQLQGAYDYVVVVDAAEETQLARLTAQRRMTPADARERVAAQSSRETRRSVADFVVSNDGTDPEADRSGLESQVCAVWEVILSTDLVYAGVCWRGPMDAPTVLVVRAGDGVWGFPQGPRGRLDARPADAVRRALTEEAGVDSRVSESRLATYSHVQRDGSTRQFRAHLARFLANVGPGAPEREPWWCIPAEAADRVAQGRLGASSGELQATIDAALTEAAEQ